MYVHYTKFLKIVLKSIKLPADTQHRHIWHCYWLEQVSLLQLSTRWWCAFFFFYKHVIWAARTFNVLIVGESQQVRYIRSSRFPRSREL